MKQSKKAPAIPFNAYRVSPPATAGMANCRAAARAEFQRTMTARDLRLSTALRTQAGYLGAWFWIIQAGVLTLFALMILTSQFGGSGEMYPGAGVLALAGPALAAFSAPQLAKSEAFGMAELEASCLYPLPRLAALRLLLVGAADLAALLALMLVAGGVMGGWLVGAVLLFVPFNLSCIAAFLVLGRLRGRAGALVTAGALALVAMLANTLSFNIEDVVLPFGPMLLGATSAAALALFGRRVSNTFREA